MNQFQSIRVTKLTKEKFYLSIYWAHSRYRFYNGQPIGSWSTPNTLPPHMRYSAFVALEKEYLRAIDLGWTPKDDWSGKLTKEVVVPKSILEDALKSKIGQGISEPYTRKLTWIVKQLNKHLKANSQPQTGWLSSLTIVIGPQQPELSLDAISSPLKRSWKSMGMKEA